MALSNTRTGMVTSSEIVALTTNGSRPMTPEELVIYKFDNPKGTRKTIGSPGAPFYTYVEECIAERFFKHKLENDTEVKAMSWGKLCESIVHNLLPNHYILQSDVTETHPIHFEWKGTPDGKVDVATIELNENGSYRFITETITDIKCPLTRKAFYNLVKRLYHFDGIDVVKKLNVDHNEIIQQIRKDSKEGEKYYWQLISNACITGAIFAELIVFMPFYEQLEEIKKINRDSDDPYWLVDRAKDGELPFIYKETGIDNINIIRFEVPQADKDFLTERVALAIEEINK
jgi:hypothetical protein